MNSDKVNKSTPLDKYSRKKKILTPPLATLNMQNSSWIDERLPEMLWAALIRERHPEGTVYTIFRDIMMWLGDNLGDNKIVGVTHTDIAKFPPELRKNFIKHTIEQGGTDALRLLLLLPDLPAFKDWKECFSNTTLIPEEDWSRLADAISLALFHQSQEATDIRWVKLGGTIISGKIHFSAKLRDTIEKINYYPTRGDQREVRPSIRSMEMMENLQGKEYQWAKTFWDYTHKNTLCIPEVNEHNADELKTKYADVGRDKAHYMKQTRDIRQNLIDHFYATSATSGIDARHETVFGLALYALDVFIENNILLGASTTNGRVTARIILEAYLTHAYLMKKEADDELLWETYRNYGTGQISLIERKYEDENYQSSMVDLKKMDNIANEDKWSEFVPIHLGNWDTSDLRKISIDIGDKDLYDKYYPYTSGYVHANWGAVREASFQKCFNPLHRLHRIPSYGLPILPNVNEDCRLLLNKIFWLVNKAYPDFKNRIRKPPKRKEEK